nr:MAG TPA: Putative oxidoreductase [Caudoviricetes sp.]
MSKYMEGVVKLLGVELEEVFRLEKYESYFRFTREYFESSLDGNNWSIADKFTLFAVLNGGATIKKLPWKPEYNEKYYIPSINNADGYNDFYWKGDDSDDKYYNLGLVFKSKEEAIALGQKMLAVAKENNEQ